MRENIINMKIIKFNINNSEKVYNYINNENKNKEKQMKKFDKFKEIIEKEICENIINNHIYNKFSYNFHRKTLYLLHIQRYGFNEYFGTI
jgi:hypothetical protein